MLEKLAGIFWKNQGELTLITYLHVEDICPEGNEYFEDQEIMEIWNRGGGVKKKGI